ncbi:MAG TPA: SPOR domain-containing protein [bacterium]|nr:SPOR domain-containing protein [bacterium]
MTRRLIVELLAGLLVVSTAWGFRTSWQASDRVLKPIEVVSEPEFVPRVGASPVVPPVEDDVVADPLPPAPVVPAAQPEQPATGPAAGTAVTVPPPSNVNTDPAPVPAAPSVSAAGATPAPDGARHHVQVALDNSLDDALAVAQRLQAAGYPVSLSNVGPQYQVALPTDFDTATAARLVQVLQHAGFRAELIP